MSNTNGRDICTAPITINVLFIDFDIGEGFRPKVSESNSID